MDMSFFSALLALLTWERLVIVNAIPASDALTRVALYMRDYGNGRVVTTIPHEPLEAFVEAVAR
jgi:hypothetical protein